VCVELARAVGGAVVVRVTDRRHAAVGHALDVTIHLERARHFADHSPTSLLFPRESCRQKFYNMFSTKIKKK